MRAARRHPRGWAARLALAGLLALLAVVLHAATASAHANLVSTDPAEGQVLEESPDSITLTFDEVVVLAADGARLYDAAGGVVAAEGRSVDRTVVVGPEGALTDGTYVLTYRVISADSHPIAGSLTFSVGAPSETVVAPAEVDAGDPALTALHGLLQGAAYLALLLAAGLAVFTAGLLPSEPGTDQLRIRLSRVAGRAAALAVAGFALLVPVGVLYRQGQGLGGLATAAAWTGWFSADGLVALLVAVGLGLAVLALHTREGPDTAVAVGAAAVAVFSVALVGHTRTYGPLPLVVISDLVHVAAAATWFGGLVGLALGVRALAGRERLLARTLARFSLLAGGLLAVVAVAGLLLGWRILGSWSGLVETSYGVVLLVKVGLVAAVAGVAGWNRYRLLPAVLGADGYAARTESADRLRATVRVEALGLAVVLVLTGFLVDRVPEAPPAEAAPPATVTAIADEVKVVAYLAPGRVGTNTVTVQIQGLGGDPVEPFANPTVSLSSADADLGSRAVRNVASGTYVAEVVIPAPGTWTVRVSVRTGEFDNPVLTLETNVSR